MSGKSDDFQLLGFMKFYLFFQLAIPFVLAGLLIWIVSEPRMELSNKAPLILVALAAWAVWEVTRIVKWLGFTVTITDEEIRVGKRCAAWTDISAARVQVAIKFGTWIQLTPQSEDPMKIPAAIGQKDILLTLIEKHFPDIQKG